MSTQTTAPQKFNENTVDSVLSKINSFITTGDLKMPANYSVENAVRSAWLFLQETKDRNGKFALEVCTRESIATAFLEMVLKGLSVVKKQGYFIVYGNKLQFDESYFGTITIAKRDAGVTEPNANIIYKGDEFEYGIDTETGRKKIIKHIQKLENINPQNIAGAYAIVNYQDGTSDVEIMTLQQIQQSWRQGATKGESPAHKNFPDQMAMKTVISRALKIKISSADDSELMREPQNAVEAEVKQEIATNANKKTLPAPSKAIEEAKVISIDIPEAKPVATAVADQKNPSEEEMDF